MIEDRKPGEYYPGDLVVWDRNGQLGTVQSFYSPGDPFKPVPVAFGFQIHQCYPHQLKLDTVVEDNWTAFDDWLEERYGCEEAD